MIVDEDDAMYRQSKEQKKSLDKKKGMTGKRDSVVVLRREV